MDINAIHYKNLQISGTTGGSNRDYRDALQLIETGRVDVRKIISHRMAFADLDKAYEAAFAGADGKVVILQEA